MVTGPTTGGHSPPGPERLGRNECIPSSVPESIQTTASALRTFVLSGNAPKPTFPSLVRIPGLEGDLG